MKFFLVLLCIVGLSVFAARSCSHSFTEKMHPPGAAPSAGVVPASSSSGSGGVLPPLLARPAAFGSESSYGSAAREAPPAVSALYVFKNRPVPPANEFAPLLASGTRAGDTPSIVVDEAANAVLIRGPWQTVESLKGAITGLDIESPEAFVDAWMLFVTGDRVRDFEASVNWGSGSTGGSATIGADGFGVVIPAGLLSAHINLMASNGVLEVVDRPQLRLSSGHRSEVSTGDDVPFPSTTFENGISRTSIEFKSVGLHFGVTPLFLGANRVRLDVDAENGLLGATQKIGDVEVPSISRQTLHSAATLGFDDAMVLGGLESVRKERRFGLLGKSEKTQVGRLYVCVMLRSGIPKAKPVIGPSLDFPLRPPGELGDPSPFDQSLLPPKGWKGSSLWPDGIEPKGNPLPTFKPGGK